jgi:hypothetical protein
MRHFIHLLNGLILCAVFNTTAADEPSAAAAQLAVQAIPATPAIEKSDTTMTMPDGSSKNLKAPYASVKLEIKNKSADEPVNIDLIVFYIKQPVEEEEIYQFKLSEPLKIAAGETVTTNSFYLDKLPDSGGAKLRVSVSITGWKNTGSEPGDEFATGAGFNLQ